LFVTSQAGSSEIAVTPRFTDPDAQATAAGPVAPVPGTVVAVHCAAGDEVDAGQVLVVLEAMKVEHRIESAAAGLVEAVLVEVGDAVEAHQVLVRVT
jgi:propionyl-CoA carboxylase alpha chain